MRGQQQSGMRRLNGHWQSSTHSHPVPPVVHKWFESPIDFATFLRWNYSYDYDAYYWTGNGGIPHFGIALDDTTLDNKNIGDYVTCHFEWVLEPEYGIPDLTFPLAVVTSPYGSALQVKSETSNSILMEHDTTVVIEGDNFPDPDVRSKYTGVILNGIVTGDRIAFDLTFRMVNAYNRNLHGSNFVFNGNALQLNKSGFIYPYSNAEYPYNWFTSRNYWS